MSYLEERRNQKIYGKKAAEKKVYSIPKKGVKKLAEEAAAKESGTDAAMDMWFDDRRKEMTGVCQCGCGKPSQKNDDEFYRHCCCHIFPKSIFKSISLHPLNFIERAFWGGCHSVMDDTSIQRWPKMKDWDLIKERFVILSPLLTVKEKAKKFYINLEKLVYGILGSGC